MQDSGEDFSEPIICIPIFLDSFDVSIGCRALKMFWSFQSCISNGDVCWAHSCPINQDGQNILKSQKFLVRNISNFIQFNYIYQRHPPRRRSSTDSISSSGTSKLSSLLSLLVSELSLSELAGLDSTELTGTPFSAVSGIAGLRSSSSKVLRCSGLGGSA